MVAATVAGWVFGILIVPVPSLICLVAAAIQARNAIAGGDVLGLVGDVFADIGLGEAELVGQQERFAVFPQRELPVLAEWVDRHRKETQIHCLLLPGADLGASRPRVARDIMHMSKSRMLRNNRSINKLDL